MHCVDRTASGSGGGTSTVGTAVRGWSWPWLVLKRSAIASSSGRQLRLGDIFCRGHPDNAKVDVLFFNRRPGRVVAVVRHAVRHGPNLYDVPSLLAIDAQPAVPAAGASGPSLRCGAASADVAAGSSLSRNVCNGCERSIPRVTSVVEFCGKCLATCQVGTVR